MSSQSTVFLLDFDPLLEWSMVAEVVTVDTIWLQATFLAKSLVIFSVPSSESPLTWDNNLQWLLSQYLGYLNVPESKVHTKEKQYNI